MSDSHTLCPALLNPPHRSRISAGVGSVCSTAGTKENPNRQLDRSTFLGSQTPRRQTSPLYPATKILVIPDASWYTKGAFQQIPWETLISRRLKGNTAGETGGAIATIKSSPASPSRPSVDSTDLRPNEKSVLPHTTAGRFVLFTIVLIALDSGVRPETVLTET